MSAAVTGARLSGQFERCKVSAPVRVAQCGMRAPAGIANDDPAAAVADERRA